MTLNQVMNISRQSMMNNQYALTVVSHNIANMNTPGYARRGLHFAEDVLQRQSTNLVSTIRGLNGAQISGIVSYTDTMINTAVRSANSESVYYGQLNYLLGKMSSITAELDETGLQAMFGEFFAAAQHLSKYPTDSAARQNYIQASRNVSQKFNSLANDLDKQKIDICGNYLQPSTVQDSQIAMLLEMANTKLEQLAELNRCVLHVGSEYGNSIALIDEREKILEELSSIIPISVMEDRGGTIIVLFDNIKLLAGAEVENKFVATAGTTADDPIIIQLQSTRTGHIGGDLNYAFDSRGAVGAMLKMVTTQDGFLSLNTLMNRLDTLANDFMAAVNYIQTYVDSTDPNIKACYLTRDASGNVILAYDPPPPLMFIGTGARDMQVNDEIIKNSMLIATARVNTDVTTNTNWWLNVGNGDNILLTAELRNKNIIDSTNLGAPPDNTIEGYLTATVTRAAMQGQDIERKAKSFNDVTAILQNERNSIIAVNLDEELADMIKYQRAYEASARMFSAADEILRLLCNLGRY